MQLKKPTRDMTYPDSAVRPTEEEMDSHDSYYPEPEQTMRTSRAVATAHGESVIDVHSTFDGKYETDQDLRVEGTVSGEIVCRGLLTIESEATANAKIQTRDAAIRGRVDGEVVCSGRLLLTATAVVTGTLKAATLVIEEGASLRGTVETAQDSPVPLVTRVNRAAQPPAPEPASADEEPAAGAATASAASPRNGSRSREVPSFALVSSDERSTLDRN